MVSYGGRGNWDFLPQNQVHSTIPHIVDYIIHFLLSSQNPVSFYDQGDKCWTSCTRNQSMPCTYIVWPWNNAEVRINIKNADWNLDISEIDENLCIFLNDKFYMTIKLTLNCNTVINLI